MVMKGSIAKRKPNGAGRTFFLAGMVLILAATFSAVGGAAERELRTLAIDQLPWHVPMVVGASVLGMRGNDRPADIWPVVIAPPAAAGLRDPEFLYSGFSLADVAVIDTRMSERLPGGIALRALLTFVDGAGRRARTLLGVHYTISERDVEIAEANVLPVAPARPEARLFIVPAEAFPGPVLDTVSDPLELLRQVSAKAVTGPAAGRVTRAPGDYTVFAFFLDRLPPDAEVQLRVSDVEDGIGGDPGNSVGLYYQGWRVAVLRARFAIDAGLELFLKAVYRPGSGVPAEDRKPRLAGVLSSHRGSGAGPASR